MSRGIFFDDDARKERPYKNLGRYALANGFGLDKPRWKISTTTRAWNNVREYCEKQSIAADLENQPEGRNMVVLGIGAMDNERQWPPSCFAALVANFDARWPEKKIMLVRPPSAMPIVTSIIANPNAQLGLIAKTAPLDEAVALLTAAQAFIGNDAGLLNIAAACGRPTIGIFAQSRPLDYTDNIIPVVPQDGKCGEAGAIGRIMPEQAFSVVAATLHRQGAAGAEQPVT